MMQLAQIRYEWACIAGRLDFTALAGLQYAKPTAGLSMMSANLRSS